MRTLFQVLFFQPLHNTLIWLTKVIPGGDIGVAIIILTLAVKFLLFPLQHRMTKTQVKLQELSPQLKEIKKIHAQDTQKQAQEVMALYRQHGINPFSGFILLLIQIPILLALFWVFKDSFNFGGNAIFLGLIDLTKKSWVLAILAGMTQYFQLQLAMPPVSPTSSTTNQIDFTKSLSRQMRFTLPVMIVVISLGLPAAVALYWVTSNLFSIVHEVLIRRQIKTPVVN